MRSFVLLILLCVSIQGQSIIDSTFTTGIDSTLAVSDSTIVADTTKKSSMDIDAIIYSKASDSLHFDLSSKMMYLYGEGELKYKQATLNSGKIDVDFTTNDIAAKGILDPKDSTDTKIIQTPVLAEAGQTYEGTYLNYNFKTQRGFISLAKNSNSTTSYQGEKVKKIDKDTYFVENGMFTTCDSDTPHTYFQASKMKVIQNDQIIARWVFMYIGGVPFPIPLPFGVFPNQSGRRSGLIIPSPGYMKTRGHYFNNFGYYFALSDYMDLALMGDYYTRGGYALSSRFRYNKRYDYSGNVFLKYQKSIYGEETDEDRSEIKDYQINITHNQKFTPTMSLDANLSFQSRTNLQNTSINYNDLLRQNISSSASFSKRWDDAGTSLNISYSRNQDLQDGDISETLPNVRFSKQIFYPFRSSTSSRADQKWYELIGVNYNGQFLNRRNKTDGNLKIRGGIKHTASVSASPKIGYFNLSTSFNYDEKWYNKYTRQFTVPIEKTDDEGNVTVEDTLMSEDIHDISMVRTFNMSVSASTKLYGIWQPRILGIEAFRHTITPQISYNLSPDFTTDKWGYYDTYTEQDGTIVRYDKYSNEVFQGVGSAGESQNLSFGVGNLFEMKTMKDPTDTTSQEHKITLLNWSINSGYNFAADSLRLQDLRMSFRTQIGELLNFSGSTAYTFYDYHGNKLDRFLASEGRGLFRLTNLSFSLSTSLSGDKISGSRDSEEDENDNSTFRQAQYISIYDEEPPDFSIPWNLSLSYNYNMNKTNPTTITETSSVGINLSFSLTKNWKFTARSNYDFIRDEFLAPAVTVYRDLHCWEMNFSWYPIGMYRGFRFELRMKAPEFRDLKVTKRSGTFSGR